MAETGAPAPRPPQPAVRPTSPERTGETVTVACKLPQGLILRVFYWQEYDELMRDGTVRQGKRGIPIEGMQFVVRGTWTASAGQAYNVNNSAVAELLPGGYALTSGCPKEIWDQWREQNKDSLLIKNRIVFAHSMHGTVVEESSRLRATQTGLEPLNKDKPAERMPGGVDRRLRLGVLDQGDGTTPR